MLPLLLALAASPPADAADGRRSVALLLNPAQLTLPRAELTVDVRVASRTSVAGLLGVDLASPLKLSHFGGQVRHAFAGEWERGAFLGGEVVTGDGSFLHEDTSGVAFGAMVGGRYTFNPALTLEAAVGGRLHWKYEKLYPGALLNLGFGWSF